MSVNMSQCLQPQQARIACEEHATPPVCLGLWRGLCCWVVYLVLLLDVRVMGLGRGWVDWVGDVRVCYSIGLV